MGAKIKEKMDILIPREGGNQKVDEGKVKQQRDIAVSKF